MGCVNVDQIPKPVTKEWLWGQFVRIGEMDRMPRRYGVCEQLEVDYCFLRRVQEVEPGLMGELVESYRRNGAFNVSMRVRDKLMERGLI
jgi:hypothetical protein